MDKFALSVCLIALVVPARAEFVLTGTYEGMYACDSTTNGVPSTWARPMSARIKQSGDRFQMDLAYTDKQEQAQGAESSLYEGQLALSADGSLMHGFFEACGGSFPSKEIARIFPSATGSTPFSMSITSVWVSDQVPGLPGLTTQVCMWSLTRTSTDVAQIRSCDTNTD
ncbi:MAG: hypothetical protein AAF503_01895 [Pseudomonadota bacterium]